MPSVGPGRRRGPGTPFVRGCLCPAAIIVMRFSDEATFLPQGQMSVESLTIATEAAARRRIGVTLLMSTVVVLLALISLGIGPVRLSPWAVLEALFGGGSDASQGIVREI